MATSRDTRPRVGPIVVGERVSLVPRTLGAARECWSMPRGIVVRVEGDIYHVRLDDETVVRTSAANVSRRKPAPRDHRPRVPRPRPLVDAEEIPLFDIDTSPQTGRNGGDLT